jgi:hypothetical protein
LGEDRLSYQANREEDEEKNRANSHERCSSSCASATGPRYHDDVLLWA